MSDLIINNHVIDTPIGDILAKVKSELRNGKLSCIEKKQDDYTVTCPSHKNGHEAHPSCQIYCGDSPDIEYGYMHCFTCGENGSLWHFIGLCFDKDDNFGKEWLIERFGNTFIDRELHLEDINIGKPKNDDFLDENILDTFQTYHPYMDKRHLSKEVCNKFKIRYDPETRCIVFPVWDTKGRLYMLTRRSVESKRFIIDAKKEKPVYLLNYIEKNDIKTVMVCESQINALTGWSMNIPSIATFGCGVTPKQFDELNKSCIRHYVLAFDGDDAGDRGTRKFLKNIRKDVFTDVILIPRGKDVNDLTPEEFNKLETITGEDWKVKNKKNQISN
jgi:DNA primase